MIYPTNLEDIYRDGPNLGPHIRHFERQCVAKGASEGKAHEWARRQVKRGRRAPLPCDGRTKNV